MNPNRITNSSSPADTQISRRSLTKFLAAGAVGATVGLPLGLAKHAGAAASVDDRILVIVEQAGGLDSLSTLVPYENGVYRDLRAHLAHSAGDVVDFGSGMGLHKGLNPLRNHNLAIVEGVGLQEHEGSHFVAQDWWSAGGDSISPDRNTGFVGRVCDELQLDSEVTGMTISNGRRTMASLRESTGNLVGLDQFAWLHETNTESVELRKALGTMAAGTRGGNRQKARKGLDSYADLTELTRTLAAPSAGYPDDRGARDLGEKMSLVSQLVRSRLGIRVFHVMLGGFDTHIGHRTTTNEEYEPSHDGLIDHFGTVVNHFMDDMAATGFGDRVVVASTTEFGRRVPANGNGTDHGWSSCGIVCGPTVVPGRHGSDPGLNNLEGGNQRPTVLAGEYLATLAEDWLGVPARLVQPGASAAVSGLLG